MSADRGVELVAEVAERHRPIDVAVVFAGGAKTPLLGDAFLMRASPLAVEAARIFDAGPVAAAQFEPGERVVID